MPRAICATALLTLAFVPAGHGDEETTSASATRERPPKPTIGRPTVLDPGRQGGRIRVEVPVTYSTRKRVGNRSREANTGTVRMKAAIRGRVMRSRPQGTAARTIGDRGRVRLKQQVAFSAADSAALRRRIRAGSRPRLTVTARHDLDRNANGKPEASSRSSASSSRYTVRKLTPALLTGPRRLTGSNAIKLDVQNSTGADLVVRAVQVLDGKVTHQDSGTTIANGAKYYVDANGSGLNPAKPVILMVGVAPASDPQALSTVGAAYTYFAPNQYCTQPASGYQIGISGTIHGDATVDFDVGASRKSPAKNCTDNNWWDSDN